MPGYSDDQLEFVHKLEDLSNYAGKPADDEFRDLIGDIQDEFNNMKRGAVREGLEDDDRLLVGDVRAFGANVGQDFPQAQKGCELFAAVCFVEKIENAHNN